MERGGEGVEEEEEEKTYYPSSSSFISASNNHHPQGTPRTRYQTRHHHPHLACAFHLREKEKGGSEQTGEGQ